MQIKQWEDKYLAQFSYGVLSDCEKKIVLIDPARNPQPYLDFAKENAAEIVGIIETHPHADFISSHCELKQRTGATIYTSSLVDARYPHQAFDEGQTIQIGKIRLTALNTPGHSPDSISVLLEHDGKDKAIFSGDTLFVGDCGRPDLREGAGNLRAARKDLATNMYQTLREKFMPLADDVILYPAHGAGTLCGKGLGDAKSSTMGAEKQTNWSLQPMSDAEFVEALLKDQPFVPAYFPYDVEVNRKGAKPFQESVAAVTLGTPVKSEGDLARLAKNVILVDARNGKAYKKEHLPHSVNLMEGEKFETWLGSIIKPEEPFYLAAEDEAQLKRLIARAAAIGYEAQIKEAFVLEYGNEEQPLLNIDSFKENTKDYTIVDVRNASEAKLHKPFAHSINIPLPELRARVHEIPTSKPVVVHCAGGYRSAAGSSIVNSELGEKTKVFDLGEAIKKF